MPQWDFLNFLRESGKRFASLKVMMNADATDLIWSGDTVVGVKANTPEGPVEIRADLTIGCDGRHSIVRQRANLEVEEIGAPMDVLWFRAGKRASENESVFARLEPGKMMVTFDRGDYWQCAYVIAKGQYDAVKARGLDAFRDDVIGMAPILKSGMSDVKTWDDVKLLTVAINRLKRWTRARAALHRRRRARDVAGRRRRRQSCGSGRGRDREPAGGEAGQGLSVRRRTRRGAPAPGISGADDAGDAGRRPEQHHQRRAQARRSPLKAPLFARVINALPWLQGITARFVALGVRPEHVRSPAVSDS